MTTHLKQSGTIKHQLALAVVALGMAGCVNQRAEQTGMNGTLWRETEDRLFHGIEAGDADEVERALATGASPCDEHDGRFPLLVAADKGKIGVVRLLLQAGAKVDATDQNGLQPLHFAAGQGAAHVVKLLLDSGAKVDAVSKEGITPLHCAVISHDAGTVRLLLKAGADPESTTTKGEFPLLHAMSDPSPSAEIVGLLLRTGASTTRPLPEGFIYTFRRMVEKKDIPVLVANPETGLMIEPKPREREENPEKSVAIDCSGGQPIHVAAFFDNLAAVERLLAAGVQPDAKTAKGDTPLSIAEQCGHKELAEYLKKLAARAKGVILDVESTDTSDGRFPTLKLRPPLPPASR